ncbi:hypothetical protein BD779DRAFT_1538564 [Infundibulicybe gibba]|nr:hypothetical protein BD779DRAFT_1538564 [Infundibulicybe gibba]
MLELIWLLPSAVHRVGPVSRISPRYVMDPSTGIRQHISTHRHGCGIKCDSR